MIDLFGDLRLGDLAARAGANWPDREALVYGEQRWTFRQLDEEVDRHAWALTKAGLGRGDRIGLWFTSRPSYIFLLFAVARLGAVAVPLNTR